MASKWRSRSVLESILYPHQVSSIGTTSSVSLNGLALYSTGTFPTSYFVYPFRTASESDGLNDEDSDDLDRNPPYPSYRVDRYLHQVSESHQAQEHRKEILQWASDIQ
jgi:hypothetical protein